MHQQSRTQCLEATTQETTSIPKEMVSKIQDKECIKYYANGFMESGEDENVSACM